MFLTSDKQRYQTAGGFQICVQYICMHPSPFISCPYASMQGYEVFFFQLPLCAP